MNALIQQILDKARWAPSGDNAQSWRFSALHDYAFIIECRDTRHEVVYDYFGRPSQIAIGVLLETIRIAASHFGYLAEFHLLDHEHCAINADCLRYRVDLIHHPELPADPLFAVIEQRSVNRRSLSRLPLNEKHQEILQQALGPAFRLRCFGSAAERKRFAGIWWHNAYIRLTMAEAYPVHKSVIAWNSRYSEDKIPDQALGANTLSLKLMRWALQSWQRIDFMNRYLAGTLIPRLQLDLIPALNCAAHFTLEASQPPRQVADFVLAGQALQRFWLTATQLGLQMQPAMTPLIFNWYAESQQVCTQDPKCWQAILDLQRRLQQQLGAAQLSRTLFMGRLGYGEFASARSLRKPLTELIRH